MAELSEIRESVRERYAAAAKSAAGESGCCGAEAGCGPADAAGVFGAQLYADEAREAAPEAAVEASLGCGVPTAVAELDEGEVVLDLGSGAGADALISARRVGPSGKAIGLDMTDEMLELARTNARQAGVDNVEFLEGYIEEIPLSDESVDVVISNCRDQPVRRQAPRPPRGRQGSATGRSLRRHRRDRRSQHGRGDPCRHARVDGLHRRRPDRGGV